MAASCQRLLSLLALLIVGGQPSVARARPEANDDPGDVRGIEQHDRKPGDLARDALSGALFLPRLAFNGLLYSTGYGVSAAENPKFIARAKDILLFLDKGGLYPTYVTSSESFPALGGNLFYRTKNFGIVAGGAYSNDDFWSASSHVSLQRVLGSHVLKATLSGKIDLEDDRLFHGIGARPESDPRSFFLPGAPDSGLYLQRREEVDLVFGLRAASHLEIFLDNLYRRRAPRSPSEGGDRFADVFDTDALPGGDTRTEKLYHELSARYDTRRFRKVLSPGLRVQGYTGVAYGVGGDRGRLLRAGADVTGFLPVIRRNRLIVLRTTLDTVENLRDEVPIAFTEYPRHLTFRGVSSRRLLRSDDWVLVPSAAYAWPLSANLSGELFADGLLVARSADELSLSGAPWAAGFAIDVHTPDSAVGRVVISGGSEGLHFGFEFGSPIQDNDRSRWN